MPDTSSRFQFGDRVAHSSRPEWGVGVVTSAQPANFEGKPCQRLAIRFERVGLKTVLTGAAPITAATQAAIPEAGASDEAAAVDGVSDAQAEQIMARLPEPCVDPFASAASRLKATLEVYRFTPTGGSLVDWAAAQSGLADPLSRFNRHQLEHFFQRFARNRDQHLKQLVLEMKRSSPAELAQGLASAPSGAKDVVRRLNA